MPGRSYQSSTPYKYGMNGMEKDDEIVGSGNSYDFGARQYDPRLGRWLSIDPKFAKYPEMSPYTGMGNNPIAFIDGDGRDIILFFYSQTTSASGAGHVAVAVGQSNDNLTYFSHYPEHDDAPGGGRIVKGTTFENAKNYDVNQGLQSSGPAMIIRIKTKDDVDAQTVAKLTEMVQQEWSPFGPNCADGGKTACDQANVDYTGGELISSPSILATSILTKNPELVKNKTITVEQGNVAQFVKDNPTDASTSVVNKSVSKAATSVSNSVGGFFKSVGNFFKDVKDKTVEGVNSINNWAPGGGN